MVLILRSVPALAPERVSKDARWICSEAAGSVERLAPGADRGTVKVKQGAPARLALARRPSVAGGRERAPRSTGRARDRRYLGGNGREEGSSMFMPCGTSVTNSASQQRLEQLIEERQ